VLSQIYFEPAAAWNKEQGTRKNKEQVPGLHYSILRTVAAPAGLNVGWADDPRIKTEC